MPFPASPIDESAPVSATTATPTQSRTSFSASLGTMKDARKIGKNLFPVHRKATISPSAASKVSVLLDFRPLRTCRVWRPSSIDISIVRVHFDRPDPLHRRPRHRTVPDVPPLRLPYASTSALPTSVDLLLFSTGVVWPISRYRRELTLSARLSHGAIVGRGVRVNAAENVQVRPITWLRSWWNCR